jgi:hypothetical protein
MAKTNTAEKLSPVVPAKSITRTEAELSAQFAAYDKADQEVRTLERNLEIAIAKRSDAVRIIGKGGAGPYNFKGRLLTVTSRVNEEKLTELLEKSEPEDDEAAETKRVEKAKEEAKRYFFKSTGDQVVIAVK